MSLAERPVVLQQRNAEPHAAPLRAKIAQFESKGGVPVPRGLQSFGIGAPPPIDPSQQRRGELYGNRMKPVWVPSAGPPSLAAHARDEGRGQRQARTEMREKVAEHLPSPPESPPAASVSEAHDPSPNASASEPPSPASTVREQFATVQEAQPDKIDLPEQPKQEYVYQMPTIVVSDEEDDVLDPIYEDPEESPLHSPTDITAPSVAEDIEEPLPPSPPAVVQPPSPPLPPSPSISPTEPPLPDAPHEAESVELEVNNQYGTISISPPPRVESMAQPQGHLGQTFTCVVHGRVREPPVRRAPVPLTQRPAEKCLPPPPPSPGFTSYSDLTALVENAAALERRLVAGELPADVIKRLSMRPAPVIEAATPAAVAPVNHDLEGEHKSHTKHTFRNPLAKKRSRKLKEESDSALHEDAAHLTSWLKLASTSRHAKSPAVAPVH